MVQAVRFTTRSARYTRRPALTNVMTLLSEQKHAENNYMKMIFKIIDKA